MSNQILIPEEYERLLDRDWREVAVEGGRFSLKSGTVARVILKRAMEERTRIACLREFQNSIAESSHQLLVDVIEQYKLPYFKITDKNIINTNTGSNFIFKGMHRNEQSIKSTEGLDLAWCEESQTLSKNSLETLTPTLRNEGAQIIYTYNRLLENDPIHERLVVQGRPNSMHIHTDYRVAEKYGYLPKAIKDEIEDDKEKRPGLYKHKWLGQPNNVEGRIYQDWEIIDEIPHEARLWRIGLDFGYTIDASVGCQIWEYNGGYIINEIFYRKGMSNKHIADILNNQENNCLVIADSAEPKSIDEIASYGVQIAGCTKGQGSVNQGIQFVQDQKISITRKSQKTIQAYQNYCWKVDVRTTQHLPVPDDTIHEWSNSCLVGNTKILLKNGRRKNIKNIKIGDYVKTQKGNQKVTDKQLTQKQAEIYEIVLSNGYRLKGTGNHKIYTNRGKVAIDALRDNDTIQVLNLNKIPVWKKSLHTMESDIIGMVTIIQDIYHDKKEKDQVNSCIEKYGKTLTEKFQKDITYTTRTDAQQIIELVTLNLLKLINTYQTIQKECGQVMDLKIRCQNIWNLLKNLQRTGILLKKEKNGTVNTERSVGNINKLLEKIAKYAEKNMKLIFQNEVNFATLIVERKHCGKEDVYNLTVEKEHNYYANGILVANCDAIRYGFNGASGSSRAVEEQKQQFAMTEHLMKEDSTK